MTELHRDSDATFLHVRRSYSDSILSVREAAMNSLQHALEQPALSTIARLALVLVSLGVVAVVLVTSTPIHLDANWSFGEKIGAVVFMLFAFAFLVSYGLYAARRRR
jgi:hypothetical protein